MRSKTNDCVMKPMYKWGVALSGGGARGFAHLGALQAMEERGIKPEIISGTSAGSLAGAFYADGYSPKEIYAIFQSIKFRNIVSTTLLQDGFFKTTGLQATLERYLRAKRFEDLKIPLRVVASDIEEGKPYYFTSGELIPAVIASCSVPIVFTPTEIDGHHYVDGGMFVNFPVSVIRKDCQRIIGIDVSPVITMKYDRSFRYIIERSMNYMVGANTKEEIKLCDYLIGSNEVSQYSLFDLKHGEDIYNKGYNMAVECLDKNKERIARDMKRGLSSKGLKHNMKKIVKAFSGGN